MADGVVRLRLDDGQAVNVTLADMKPIYDALWALSAEPGAVSTAALLLHEAHHPIRHTVELTVPQSAVLRKAMERIELAT
jgi:hypothetical protein